MLIFLLERGCCFAMVKFLELADFGYFIGNFTIIVLNLSVLVF